MNYNTVFIIIIIFTLSVSGYYINFVRIKENTAIVNIAKDNSLFIFRFLIPFAIILSLGLYFSKKGGLVFPDFVLYVGYILVIFGLVFRWIAVKSLGKAFRVKVSLIEGQELYTKGIYKWVRHPSYTGLLLYYLGLGIVMQNYFSLLLLVAIPFYVVTYRIKLEEQFLIASFGNTYIDYSKDTYKLFPYLY